jgi:hypothetical protein
MVYVLPFTNVIPESFGNIIYGNAANTGAELTSVSAIDNIDENNK